MGLRRVGPKGGASRRVGARTVGAQNFALFPLPPQFLFLLPSLVGLFRGILVVFEAPGRSNVHVWSSRAVVCEPWRPGLVGPPGFHTTTREPKRAHLRVPVFKNTTKFNEKDQQEREKRKNCGGRVRKKWEILGGPAEGGPAEGGSGREALNTPTTHTAHNNTETQHTTQQTSKNKQHRTLSHTKTNHNNTQKNRIGQKWIGQNWIGQNWLAKHDGQKWIGQNWIGQSRP